MPHVTTVAAPGTTRETTGETQTATTTVVQTAIGMDTMTEETTPEITETTGTATVTGTTTTMTATTATGERGRNSRDSRDADDSHPVRNNRRGKRGRRRNNNTPNRDSSDDNYRSDPPRRSILRQNIRVDASSNNDRHVTFENDRPTVKRRVEDERPPSVSPPSYLAHPTPTTPTLFLWAPLPCRTSVKAWEAQAQEVGDKDTTWQVTPGCPYGTQGGEPVRLRLRPERARRPWEGNDIP